MDTAPHPLMVMVERDAMHAKKRALEARRTALVLGERFDREHIDFAMTEVERYACDVRSRMSRFGGVKVTIALTADFIERASAGQDTDTDTLFEVVRHHLVVHRTQMPTAKDTALRLIAAVWDLGVTAKVLVNEQIIFSNRHMTKELNAALTTLRKIVEPHVRERHDILHEGGVAVPTALDLDAINDALAELGQGEAAEFLGQTLGKGFERTAALIHADVGNLMLAEKELFDALAPIYKRRVAMLRAVEPPHGQ